MKNFDAQSKSGLLSKLMPIPNAEPVKSS